MKNIIVLFDGTGNDDSDPKGFTNVARLSDAIGTTDRNGCNQFRRYISGVATTGTQVEKKFAFFSGYGLSNKLIDGYCYIVENFQLGDRVFIFGFSRGAYTARSLAGMIYNVGILRHGSIELVKQAYEIYRSRDDDWRPGAVKSEQFREEFSHPKSTGVFFLGVWDTVAALGAPFGTLVTGGVNKLFNLEFHDTKLNKEVQHAYHAVSIDERRWPYRPVLWKTDPGRANCEELWFPGIHNDIGGGRIDGVKAERGLTDFALEWICDKASDAGLQFDKQKLDLRPDVVTPIGTPEDVRFLNRVSRLLVKPLASVGLLYNEEVQEASRRILPNGEYLREVPCANLSSVAREKQKQDTAYMPSNLEGCL